MSIFLLKQIPITEFEQSKFDISSSGDEGTSTLWKWTFINYFYFFFHFLTWLDIVMSNNTTMQIFLEVKKLLIHFALAILPTKLLPYHMPSE